MKVSMRFHKHNGDIDWVEMPKTFLAPMNGTYRIDTQKDGVDVYTMVAMTEDSQIDIDDLLGQPELWMKK